MMSWLIVVLVVIAVVAVGALVYEQGRSAALKRRFGPEYERAVETQGGRRQAEAGLRDVLRRRRELDVRPLPASVRARYEERWRETQLRFVDEPAGAVRQAEALVADVLRERGYPADTEERTAMLSADHPDLVAHYRTAGGAHAGAGVEPLRQAFIHYRDVFERLTEAQPIPLARSTEDGGRRWRFSNAYGTVLDTARRIDPAGRVTIRPPWRRNRDGRETADT